MTGRMFGNTFIFIYLHIAPIVPGSLHHSSPASLFDTLSSVSCSPLLSLISFFILLSSISIKYATKAR